MLAQQARSIRNGWDVIAVSKGLECVGGKGYRLVSQLLN